MHKVYLSLGANIGNRKRAMRDAVALLNERVGNVERMSSLYETEPWGFETPNKFINACAEVTTPLAPVDLLRATQQIELELGRTGKSVDGIYHDRAIDIDILLYDDLRVDLPFLQIPHPLMQQRDFVMKPLNELLGEKKR